MDMLVEVRGVRHTSAGTFTFSPAHTPVVTALSPARGSAGGGSVLTLVGAQLAPSAAITDSIGEDDDDYGGAHLATTGARVVLGKEVCTLESESTAELMKCVLPPNTIGVHIVEVMVRGLGWAITEVVDVHFNCPETVGVLKKRCSNFLSTYRCRPMALLST